MPLLILERDEGGERGTTWEWNIDQLSPTRAPNRNRIENLGIKPTTFWDGALASWATLARAHSFFIAESFSIVLIYYSLLIFLLVDMWAVSSLWL